MSAVTTAPAVTRATSPVASAYRAELDKLRAQLTTRLLGLVCLLAPFAFTAVLQLQSGTPADALFGVWVHSSGFAVSLVILGFAGSWGFPIVAGVLAGDLFSSEDRHGTWKTILTRACTREDMFAGKVLAAGTVGVGLGMVLAVASLLAGAIFVGMQPLVNLSGGAVTPGRMGALVAVSWMTCVLPLLAYLSLAVLFSVVSRNGIVGVLGPLLVALVTQLLDLIGKGVIVHLLLPGTAFDGWHGLLSAHAFLAPLLVSSIVCLAWIAGCLTAAWRIVRRRDVIAGTGQGAGWAAPLRAVTVAAAIVGLLALACNLGPTGVTARRVAAAIGPEFNRVSLHQQALIGRHAPPGAALDVQPRCNRRGARAIGPGDWNCTLYVYLPQPRSVPFQLTQVEYEVSVQSNGCYKAQSPPAFVGGPTMLDAAGRSVTNPLFVVCGCFDIL